MMDSRRIEWFWILSLLASAASCSGGGDEDGALGPSRGGLGDGEIPGQTPAASESAGPALATGEVAPSAAAPGADGFAADDSGSDAASGSGAGAASRPASGSDSAGLPAPVAPGGDTGVGPLVPSAPQPAAGTLTAGVRDDNRNLERFLGYREALHQQNMSGLLDFTAADHEAAHEALAQQAAHATLDVSLVIDTTGSMGDELRYLQTEFVAISSAIESKYPNAEQRWSLVLYKDEGDEYVVRWFDFRADALDFRGHLAEQSAGGGGDFPEAPDRALDVMNQLAWRADPGTARLAFWVADAPHHPENAAALKAGIEAAEAHDIHIYPVASSGIDELTELTMRSAAQLTGGRYLFLTDDSGVGNAHKEPSIPCYFVTQLDAAILRMVDVEMSGEYREPAADEIVRSSGDPQDGTCMLDSGQPAFSF